MTGPNYPKGTVGARAAADNAGAADPGVGHVLQCDLHVRHEAWLLEQYLRDDAVLTSLEARVLEQAGEPEAWPRVTCARDK